MPAQGKAVAEEQNVVEVYVTGSITCRHAAYAWNLTIHRTYF